MIEIDVNAIVIDAARAVALVDASTARDRDLIAEVLARDEVTDLPHLTRRQRST